MHKVSGILETVVVRSSASASAKPGGFGRFRR